MSTTAPLNELLLAVDLGNSACKLALWTDGGELVQSLSVEHRGRDVFALEQDLARALAGWPLARRVGWSSVASKALEQGVQRALERADWPAASTPDAGLTLELEDAHSVGPDRLFAARAAFTWVQRACLVVNLGTALTVDAVAPPLASKRGGSETARPRFLGGAIALGPALWMEALRRGTARLDMDLHPRPGAPALGRRTKSALEAGLVHGLRGSARELLVQVAKASGISSADWVLTGGARAFLLEPEPIQGTPLLVDPNLVLRGIFLGLGPAGRTAAVP